MVAKVSANGNAKNPKMAVKKIQKANTDKFKLAYSDLCWECGVQLPDFETTNDITPLDQAVLIGQPRAEMSLESGLNTPGHLYVTGMDNIHTSFVKKVKALTLLNPTPSVGDIVCLHNFKDADQPVFVHLPKGESSKFKEEMEELLDKLKKGVPEVMQSEDFRAELVPIMEGFEAARRELDVNYERIMQLIIKEAAQVRINTEKLGKLSILILRAENGWSAVPVKVSVASEGNQFVQDEEMGLVSVEENEEIVSITRSFIDRIVACNKDNNRVYSQNDKIRENAENELRKRYAEMVFREESLEIVGNYGDNTQVVEFIEGLKNHVACHVNVFAPIQPSGGAPFPMMLMQGPGQQDPFLSFKVNIFVDNSNTEGVPVIVERNPTPVQVFGRVARKDFYGSNDDHTRVKAGSLIKANGGVLILPAYEAAAYGTLLRLYAVLASGKLDVGEFGDMAGMGSNVQPSSIDIKVKIILIGDERFYQALVQHPMTESIIKTLVMFDRVTYQDQDLISQKVALMSQFARGTAGAMPFDRDAVAKLLKYDTRLAGDRDMTSLDHREMKKIVDKASYWARCENPECTVVTGAHVQNALENEVYMVSAKRDRIYELIKNGKFIIDLEGRKVGEINALAVYMDGSLPFGVPSKITANTFAGGDAMKNIEGEVDFSGPSQKKSFHILQGYFGEKYSKNSPVGLGMLSVAFEQSYGIDGDSATLAEGYAMISSLSGLPLRQNIAVTGSMNQKGVVQPIGGENEKVEGFFDVCNWHGLINDAEKMEDGVPGVIIPKRNCRNLILRDDVLEAVRDDKFRIYAIEYFDEGIEILAGVKAGLQIGVKRGENNGMPMFEKGTVNYFVYERLEKIKESQSTKRNN